MVVNKEFWKGKRVFITGHTGFKGSWLVIWLSRMGAKVSGYSKYFPSKPSMFEALKLSEIMEYSFVGDICNDKNLAEKLHLVDPEIIIHLAAQPLVFHSYLDPIATFQTNAIGTAILLEQVRKLQNTKVVCNVTSDKCYQNDRYNNFFHEGDKLGGNDPYSSSKACAELIMQSYNRSFFCDMGISVFSVRSGNVLGGGDWGQNRLVPDIIRFLTGEKTLEIRGSENTRPWQHVLEPLRGYLIACQEGYYNPGSFNESWNFGPSIRNNVKVKDLVNSIAKIWGVKFDSNIFITNDFHEEKSLCINANKAKKELNWEIIWGINRTLNETIEWYKAFENRAEMLSFSEKQIDRYIKEININEN